jgi:hypothetical protein
MVENSCTTAGNGKFAKTMEEVVAVGDAVVNLKVIPLLALSLRQPQVPAQVYRYILDFLASNPTTEEIATFRPTPEMQERLRVLLRRSKAGDLSPEETQELNEYERIEHLVIMLKAGNLPYVGQAS